MIGPMRFGAYSAQTYLRRQNQRYTGTLIGRKPCDVFTRMQRNMQGIQNEWGNLIPAPDFVKILEQSILKASEAEIKEIDHLLDAHAGTVPESLAKAMEYRLMTMQKDNLSASTRTGYSKHPQTLAQIKELDVDLAALDYTPPPPLTTLGPCPEIQPLPPPSPKPVVPIPKTDPVSLPQTQPESAPTAEKPVETSQVENSKKPVLERKHEPPSAPNPYADYDPETLKMMDMCYNGYVAGNVISAHEPQKGS